MQQLLCPPMLCGTLAASRVSPTLPPPLLLRPAMRPPSRSPLLSEGDFEAKPSVLLLGQYSTGKSTFIKYLLGRDYPGIHIGPEPTTDRCGLGAVGWVWGGAGRQGGSRGWAGFGTWHWSLQWASVLCVAAAASC